MINCSKGAEWRKWDLHLHTPSSYDYQDKSISNEDIINALVAAEVALAVITDHHVIDVSRIKALQVLGQAKGITILPGIEFLSDARASEPIHFIGAFFESSGRRGEKDLFSKLRAQRIYWIRATLEDPDSELFQGWDAKRKVYDCGRRVALVKGNYVVVISLQPEQKARFVTAYVADSETTLEKIKRGVKWAGI